MDWAFAGPCGASTLQPRLPAEKPACKTVTGTGRGTETSTVNQTSWNMKRIYLVCSECWRQLWAGTCLRAPKGDFPRFDCTSTWKSNTQSAAIRVTIAICNQTQPNATLLLVLLFLFIYLFFFSSIWNFLSLIPPLFIVSFQALISSLLNVISYRLRWNDSQARIYTSSLMKPVKMIFKSMQENAGGEFQGSLRSWAWLYGMEVITLICFDMKSFLMILTQQLSYSAAL